MTMFWNVWRVDTSKKGLRKVRVFHFYLGCSISHNAHIIYVTKLIKMLTNGELDPKIKGSRLIKMCIRCIKCFVAYYTGKSDDIASSEGECSSLDEAEMDDETKKVKVKTVNTSLTAVLNRIKEEDNDAPPEVPAPVDPLSSVLNSAGSRR